MVPVIYGVNFLYAIKTGQVGGTFGDTFGAANAFFSGVALMMLVYAVILQRDELEIIREERNDTKTLLKGQETHTQLQREAIEKQLFEQSFFSLLSLIIQEKARLLKSDSNMNLGKPELETVSRACSDLLINFAISAKIDPNTEVSLDLTADRAFNLVNLITSLVALVDSAPKGGIDRKFYGSMIQGLVDYHTAVCFAWFHGIAFEKDSALANAYKVLSIRETISDNLKDAMDAVEARTPTI